MMNGQSRSERWLLLVLMALFLSTTVQATNGARANAKKFRGESNVFLSDNNLNNFFNRRRFLQKDDKKDEKDKDDKDNKDNNNKEQPNNKVDVPVITVTKSPTREPTKAPTPGPTPFPTPMPNTPSPTRIPTTPPPTPMPTPQPTPPPTQPTGPVPLQWSTIFPLKRCEGDCDEDTDCLGELVCYQRDGGEAVPRCIGLDESRIDYCIAPWELPPPPTPGPTPNPTQPPTPPPTTGPPTAAPVVVPTLPPTPVPTTGAPTADYIACQKAQEGLVYTTDFSFTIGYYYEVVTKRTTPLLNVSQTVDAIFQQYLALELVDCELAEDSEIQGVSPAGVDNLAGSCVSQTMLSQVGDSEDLICYQMQGSVQVYLSAFYYMSLTSAKSGEVKERIWDTLREEINDYRRRKLLVDYSKGIYGLFFLSGTDPNDGIVNILGSGVVNTNTNKEGSSGTSAGEAFGYAVLCFFLLLLLYCGFRKYQSTQEEEEVDNELKASVATESEDNDSPVKRAASPNSVPPPPPPLPPQEKLEWSRPSTWKIPERLSSALNTPSAQPVPPRAPLQQHPPPTRGGSPIKPAIEVAIPNDPNISYISSLHADEYGGRQYLDSSTYDPFGTPSPPNPLGPQVTIDEDQFRVTGYSKMSNITTLAEQHETSAKITPVLHRPHMSIPRGRIEEPARSTPDYDSYDYPRFRAGHLSHYEQRANQQRNAHRGNNKKDLNESNTTEDSFGYPMQKASSGNISTAHNGNKSVSTVTLRNPATRGVPRSNYSSMTHKLSNRRVRSTQIPGVQEDDHESNLSEDQLVPYYTSKPKKPSLSTLGIGSRPPPGAGDMSSAGSFNFATLSTVQPMQQVPETPQSQFQFMERSDHLNSMPTPISMTFASNAMVHSAFKPRKLAYSSSPKYSSDRGNQRDWE